MIAERAEVRGAIERRPLVDPEAAIYVRTSMTWLRPFDCRLEGVSAGHFRRAHGVYRALEGGCSRRLF